MNCKNCKAECASRGYDCEKDCQGHIQKTNADRIRSMTDEELLEFLYWEADGSGKTPEQWISWLKQEVKDV